MMTATKSKDNKKQPVGQVFKNNFFLLGIAFKEAPIYIIARLLVFTQYQVFGFIEHVYMIGYVINAITEKKPFSHVAIFILVVFISVVLIQHIYFNMLNQRFGTGCMERILRAVRVKLYEKAAVIDLKCYDDPEFYNDFVWAMGEAATRTNQVIDTFSNIIGAVAGILLIGGYILTQDKYGLIVVALSFLGVFFISKTRNKLKIALQEKMRQNMRKRDYISRIFYLADHSNEIRMNSVKKKLFGDFKGAYEELTKTAKKGTWALSFCYFLMNFVFNTLIIDGVYLLVLLYRTIVFHTFGYGTMVALYRSCEQVRYVFRMLSFSIPQLQEHSLYVEKIYKFLNYKVEIKSPEHPVKLPKKPADITFKGVGFSYKNKQVFRDLTLTIRAGDKIALVGYNGAGKTTLVKLIMRLYDPDEGEILYGGINIKKFDLEEYRRQIGTVFQDYQIFADTVDHNITVDTAGYDESKFFAAVTKSGFYRKFIKLKDGPDTQLTKEFDENGVLLSGGESQSLAIARAFYQPHAVMILDEPSSALDPLAEYRLNENMVSLCRDKTVITISHRLSTTKMADKIYMMEQGQIIEQGSHDELMRLDGKYAAMFTVQAEKYRAGQL